MDKYPLIMRINHWVMALLVIILLVVGFAIANFPKSIPDINSVYGMHKSFGLVAFLFIIFRLSVRLRSVIPALPKEISVVEQKAAHAAQYLMYVLIFVMPISGYLMSILSGYPVAFFGYPVPALFEKHEEYGHFFRE
ncbi:MAG: cytochrome b, partial [Gammaproteobacteria bacterium]